MRNAAALGFAMLLSASVASAQATMDAGLAQIDSLVAAGELDTARSRLAAWIEAHPPGPGGLGRGAQAHALFLQGRLARNWTGAEDAYLSVVLGYPTSQHAPHALLRLGQGLLAAASIDAPSTAAIRAVSYLERLSNDYPGHPLHDEAQLWLARAHAGTGNNRQGCAVLRRALDRQLEPAIAGDVRSEWDSMCRPDVAQTGERVRAVPDSAAGKRQALPPPVTRRDTARAVPDSAARQRQVPRPSPVSRDTARTDTIPSGRYTVQVAAMRSREGARTIARQLEGLGFNARIVDLQGSGLVRVRVDVFQTERNAEALAARIRQHGFDAIVTNDVARERRLP